MLELATDGHDGLDRRDELLAEHGQCVFGRRGRGVQQRARDHAAFFQLTQARGQDARGDARDVVAQLAETAWAARQIPDDIRCPGPTQQRHAFCERTRRRRSDFAFAQRKTHDGFEDLIGNQMDTTFW